MPVNDTTANRSYQKPNIANTLSDDVGRLRSALDAIDTDMASKAPSAGPTFTGVTTVAAGSAAAPSLTFTGATSDTGLYSPGADQVAISTGGTGRVFVTSDGKVGIGSSSPSAKTEIASSGSETSLILRNTSSAMSSYSELKFAPFTGTTAASAAIRATYTTDNNSRIEFRTTDVNAEPVERLRITSTGNVGIGTSSPSTVYRQTVNGDGSSVVGGLSLRNNGTETLTIGNVTAANDVDSEIWNPRNGYLRFATNNTERLRITSTGNVGIGTSSPAFAVDVSATNDSIIRARTNGDTSAGFVGSTNNGTNNWFLGSRKDAIGGSTGTDRFNLLYDTNTFLTVATDGKVGIGTSSPSTALDVNGTIVCSSTNGGIAFAANSSAQAFDAGFYRPATSNLAIATGATERARIDSSGRLLVGTSTARANFNNSTGTAGLQVEGTSSASASISIVNNSTFDADYPVFALGKSSTGAVGGNGIVANNEELGSIWWQGNDGSEFAVSAQISAAVDGTPGANDMPGRLVFATTADGAATPTERMRIGNSGRVMIGATAGSASRLEIAGPETIATFINTSVSDATYRGTLLFTDGGGGPVGGISVNTTSTQYSTTSDYRLKENVVAVTDGITRLQQLKPSRFNFIAEPNRTVDGFIAHEVQAVIPEAVNGVKDELDKDGKPKYQGIDQSKLVPLLTAALQEAVAKIESLEARLTAAGF